MRLVLASALTFLLLPTATFAQGLRVDASQERMRVDGSLREWKGARFASYGAGDDAALRLAFATADGGLYVGAEVSDDSVVRESGLGGKQDALVLTLAMPQPGGQLAVTEVWLHPGKSGKKAAAGLASDGKALKSEARIKVVEGPRDAGGGYVLEAFVPWALVPGSEIWEQGRAVVRLEDADAPGKVESVLRTSDARRPAEFPRLLPGEGQNDLFGAFLSSQQLSGIEPRFDFRGNVAGDRAPERVLLVDRFVVVYGPAYKKGEAYGFTALPLGTGGGVKSAMLADVTGDGLDELVLVLRQKNELGARELWSVLSFAADEPAFLFSIELRKELRGGYVESDLSLSERGKGAPRIRVKVGRAVRLDASTFQEGRATDAQPILLPWGDVEARTYQYDGARFAVVDEQKRAVRPEPSTPSAYAAAEQTTEPGALEPPDVSEVIALFKKERKLPANAAPAKSLGANVFGAREAEAVLLFGTTLLVAGGDLGGGGSYMAYGLPVTNAADVVYVGTADVTGDGAREIFVRIKQPLGGASGVHRELALVLRFDELGRFGRALLLDVTRRQGASVVANRVRTRGGVLSVLPGSAEGWDAGTYPFTNEATGGAERLLLPWLDQPVTYRFEGGRFVPGA